MKEFLSEEESKLVKDKLKQEMVLDPTKDSSKLLSGRINWIEDPTAIANQDFNWRDLEGDDWLKIKLIMKDLMRVENRLIFISHDMDTIYGKPQLVHQTLQRITLITKTVKVKKDRDGDDEKFIHEWKFIDDRLDKRYDGNMDSAMSMDFWVYRIVYEGKEYYVLSQEELGNEVCKLSGMNIQLDDLSEMNKNLKIKTLSNIFLVRKSESTVQTIPKEELVVKTKEWKEKYGFDREGFKDFIFTHPDGNLYEYCEEFNNLRIAQLLSAKYEGYPLHILKMGAVGSGKTTEAEVLDHKFNEEQGILEAGSSRMKVLVPSFKEKPANLGYICKCNRYAIIDELMKMIVEISTKSHQTTSLDSYLGELNMLLEHKNRMVGSGNDNSVRVQATSKIAITTNPIPTKRTIGEHVGILDQTTLSRMLIWVQDAEETEKIYNHEVTNPPNIDLRDYIDKNKGRDYTDYVRGINSNSNSNNIYEFNPFLTIYDSCQAFLSDFDIEKVRTIWKESVFLSKEPMRQIWKSRGLHHSILILDGLTKYRCLFQDYDSTFKSSPEDYELLTKIILKMVQNWDTDLSIKSNEFKGF